MRILRRVGLGLVALIVTIYVALCIYAYWPGAPEQPVAALATSDDKFIVVGDLRLRYRTYGERGADRPNILLIHGFANTLQSFRELAPRLAACCYVVAIDMPGYGLSDKPTTHDYHNGPQAQVLVDAARALDLAGPIYAGHSLGGAVAVHAAVRDPSTRGLILMNPGILSTGVPKFVQITLPPLPRLSAKQFASRSFRERFLKTSFIRPEIVTEQVMDDVMLASRSEGYMTGTTALMQQYSEGEEVPLLGKLAAPTLLLWGSRDRNKPRTEADELIGMIPNAQLVRFNDAAHYVHEEEPDGCALAIRTWLPVAMGKT
jgi:4,5:9,10-diseco-3-hydroxy-5,9,17-trioxoandrosta-1(10),2-diene-4-oate hydrolase